MMLLQRALRLSFVRRSMATGHGHGHNTEYNGIKMTPIQEIGAFTAIFCGVLGPGILLMLFRDRPLSEH